MRIIPLLLVASLPGCATLREAAALRHVDFRFDRVSGARIAGIPIDRIRSYDDLTTVEVARLGLAVASKDVPLDIVVHVEGRNPETNNVTARLVAMDWAYLVDERETLSGRLDQPYAFPPGEPRDVPVTVTFNLVRFFGSDGRDLLDTALALSGQRASTKRVTLRIVPTVETPIGPIRYAVPLTLAAPAPRG